MNCKFFSFFPILLFSVFSACASEEVRIGKKSEILKSIIEFDKKMLCKEERLEKILQEKRENEKKIRPLKTDFIFRQGVSHFVSYLAVGVGVGYLAHSSKNKFVRETIKPMVNFFLKTLFLPVGLVSCFGRYGFRKAGDCASEALDPILDNSCGKINLLVQDLVVPKIEEVFGQVDQAVKGVLGNAEGLIDRQRTKVFSQLNQTVKNAVVEFTKNGAGNLGDTLFGSE